MTTQIPSNQLADANTLRALIATIEGARVLLAQSNDIIVMATSGGDNLNALLPDAAQNRVTVALDVELRALALSKKAELGGMGVNVSNINIAPALTAS